MAAVYQSAAGGASAQAVGAGRNTSS